MAHNVTLRLDDALVPIVVPAAAVAYQVIDCTADKSLAANTFRVQVFYYTEDDAKKNRTVFDVVSELQTSTFVKTIITPVCCNPRTQSPPEAPVADADRLKPFMFARTSLGDWGALNQADEQIDLLAQLGQLVAGIPLRSPGTQTFKQERATQYTDAVLASIGGTSVIQDKK